MSYANARNTKKPAYAKAAEKAAQKPNYWDDITGKVRVFKGTNKNGGNYYSTSLRNKTADGETRRMFVTVRFSEDLLYEYNTATIDIKRGFLAFDEYEKDGNPVQRLVLVIQDWEILDAE